MNAVQSHSESQRHTFPARLRIRLRKEFQRVLDEGRRMTDGCLTVWALPNGRPHPRLGVTAGRRHGNAVRRNRLKRVMRTAFRLAQHDLPPGFDLIASPRAGRELEVAECMASLQKLATNLVRSARWNAGD